MVLELLSVQHLSCSSLLFYTMQRESLAPYLTLIHAHTFTTNETDYISVLQLHVRITFVVFCSLNLYWATFVNSQL